MTNAYFSLTSGNFFQNWTNTAQITTSDDWSGVASIVGYRGDGLTGTTGTDPQTLTANDATAVIDVNANQANPNTFTSGGVAEFEIADPTIALAGSGTARAPYLVLYLDSTGRQNVHLSFDARDLETSADNAVQQIAVQYRTTPGGAWTNLPAGHIADATTGPSTAGAATIISIDLPPDAGNSATLEVRIMTTDAVGNDEWVGIDNISVTSSPIAGEAQAVAFSPISVVHNEGDSGTTAYSFTVTRTGGSTGQLDFSGTFANGGTDNADFVGGTAPTGFSGSILSGQNSATVTINVAGDGTIEPDENFTLTLTNVSNTDGSVTPTIGANAAATGTIVNDDASPGIFSISSQTADEGSGQMIFTVSRTGGSTGSVSVNYSTVDGTGAHGAVSPNDFTDTSGTLNFADGVMNLTFSVSLVDDSELESAETFTVTLSDPTGGATIGTGTATGTILDNDVTIIPDGSFATTYTAAAAGDYTLLAGTTRTQTAAVGVTVSATAGPANVDIEGTLNGASGQRAINYNNAVPSGLITVGNAGLVDSLNQDAIRGQSVNGTIDLTNLGQILATVTAFTPSVGGSNPGTAFAITYNAALGASGAPATDYISGGTITNGSAGNMTALIRADNGDAIRLGSHETLVNYGTINGNGPVNDSSDNNSFNGANGNTHTSTATTYDVSRGVRINQSGATAIDIENHGTITGAQHGLDTGVADATNIVVNNFAGGQIIGRSGSGIGSDTSGAAANTYIVNNHGLIRGDFNPQFDRAGYVTVDGDGDGVDIDGGATITNFAGGQILATGAGGFDNGGRANRSEGISIGGGLITNDGTISGADSGIVVNNDSNANGSRSGVGATTILNDATGTITGAAGYAIRLENKTGTAIDDDVITNYGTITGNGAIPNPAGIVLRQDGNPDASTVGTLDGVPYTAADAGNARFIQGDGAAIQMGEGNDTLADYGAITGNSGRAINMEGGADILTLRTGSSITGRIDGGAGSDTLNLALDDRPGSGGGATGNNSGAITGTLANVVNFEALHVAGGTWTIGDTQTYTGITIDNGAGLALGAGAALSGAITDNGRLKDVGSGTVTLGDLISGNGIVEQAGSGILVLSHGGNSYSGGTLLSAGTLDIAALGAAGTGTISFGAGAETLRVETAATSGGAFANTIAGFATDGDVLDAAGIGHATASYDSVSGVLTLTGTTTESFTIGTGYGGYIFNTADDGAGGTTVTLSPPPLPDIFINEIHYDNASTDANEAIEIAGVAGIDLAGYKLVLYNGSNTPNAAPTYTPLVNLSGVIDNESNGFGALSFAVVGLQNGAQDGLALVAPDGRVIQFLSYEGVITAAAGTPAAGLTSTDIGVSEDGSGPANFSLQLTGAGSNYGDFSWQPDAASSFGSLNAGQTILPANGPSNFRVNDPSVTEGNAGTSDLVFVVSRAGGSDHSSTVDFQIVLPGPPSGADANDVAAGQVLSGTLTFAVGVSSQQVVVHVVGDTVGENNETLTLTLSNASSGDVIADVSGTGTITNDDIATRAIYDIQGAAIVSPFVDQTVATHGVVTAVDSNGFYLQDAVGDGDIATSDGIFVFTNTTPTVAVGNDITLTGTVQEFVGSTAGSASTTELINPTGIVVVNASVALPAAVLIATDGTGRAPPTSVIDDDGLTSYDPTTDGFDFYESLEGMRVTIQTPRVVSNTNSFGETFVVASNGLGDTGLNSRSGNTISDGDNNPESIVITRDAGVFAGYVADHSQGDVLGNVTGILNYQFAQYELIVTAPVTTTTDVTLTRETTSLTGDASHLSYATFNVENLASVPDSSVDARNTQAKVDAAFAAHGKEIVTALHSPDIIGLQEIQDADGIGAGTDYSGTATANKLIAAIVAAGGPTYVYVEIAPTANNTTGGEPNGNIHNGFLYNPERVSYVEGSAHLLEDPAYNNTRKPLLADFVFNGQTFTAADLHSTSRGGSDPLFGADQPPTQAGDAARTAQGQALQTYITSVQNGDPTHMFIVNGDFNGYYFEGGLRALESTDGGTGSLNNLIDLLPVEERYSYYFGGYYQLFDNILVSANLYAGAQVDVVHYNAGFTDGLSATDHDQTVATIGLDRGSGPATAIADHFTTTEAAFYRGTVLANDSGGGAGLVVASVNGVAPGETMTLASGAQLVLHPDGTFTYNPDAAFSSLGTGDSATDSFTYTLAGGSSATATITITGITNAAPTSGDDTVAGTTGPDFFDLSAGGNDNAAGGAGNDVFLFGATLTPADNVNGGTGNDQVAVQGSYAGGSALTLGTGIIGIESLAILPGNDIRFGDPGTNLYSYDLTTVDQNVASGVQMVVDASRLRAGESFTFNGAAETDGSFFIYGGVGIDHLTGGDKNDVFLFGMTTSNTLRWGASDQVTGGAGLDQLALRGDYSALVTFGATQLISIEAIGLVSAHDTRFGPLGAHYSYNLQMNDGNVAAGVQMTVDGTPLHADEILTFDGSQELNGSFRVFGGKGDDTIIGSAGNDILSGGLGADLLTGNAGDDTFLYRNASESTHTSSDTIQDFTLGDIIDLTQIDADTILGGDQAFTFIGTGAFDSLHPGELRIQNTGGSTWLVQGDTNGDNVADFEMIVTLHDAHPITSTDFHL